MLAFCSCAPSCDCTATVLIYVALVVVLIVYLAAGVAIAERVTRHWHGRLRRGAEVLAWPLLLPVRAAGWLVSD